MHGVKLNLKFLCSSSNNNSNNNLVSVLSQWRSNRTQPINNSTILQRPNSRIHLLLSNRLTVPTSMRTLVLHQCSHRHQRLSDLPPSKTDLHAHPCPTLKPAAVLLPVPAAASRQQNDRDLMPLPAPPVTG